MKNIGLIFSKGENWEFGKSGDLCFKSTIDLQFFKETTLGKTVIMGRGTWDSLGKKPLPNRRNIVISSKQQSVETFSDLESALESVDGDVFIIGGASLLDDAIKFANFALVTHFDSGCDADCYISDIVRNELTSWCNNTIIVFEDVMKNGNSITGKIVKYHKQ